MPPAGAAGQERVQPLVRQQELVRQPERAPQPVPERERGPEPVRPREPVQAPVRAPERQLFRCRYRHRRCYMPLEPTPVRDRRLLRI